MADQRESSKELKDFIFGIGFDLVGICLPQPPPHFSEYQEWISGGFHASMKFLEDHIHLKSDPKTLLPSAQSLIVVALNYNQPNPAQPGEPLVARYALGRDYHKVIRGKLKKVEKQLQEQYPLSEHRACVDSAPIMERDFAQLAGLGWFGKNTMLINSQRGSWFFLGVLLTSVPFELDSPAVGGCGSCRACIDACPTGAIVQINNRWQVDARTCISYLTIEHEGEIPTELAEQVGDHTFGCDVCQEVCPFNQPRETQPLRAQITKEPDFLNRRSWPALKQLAVIQPNEWDLLTQGSPVRRTGLTGLQRNARINLSNKS